MDKLKDSFFQAYFRMPVPRIIVRTDAPNYTVIAVNDAYLLATGSTADAIVDHSVVHLFDVGHARDGNKDLLSPALDKAASVDQPVIIPEFRMISANPVSNAVIWLQMELLPVAEPDKKPAYLIISTRDISQEILSRKALDEARNREQTLHEELAATNEELLSSNEDLNTTVEQLKLSRESLQELNTNLESLVEARTADLIITQAKLLESHTLLETIVNEVPAGICVLKGPDMIIELVNRKLLQLWQRSNDILNQSIFDLMPEIRTQAFPRLLNEVYTTGVAYNNFDAALELVINGVKQTVYRDYSYTPLKNPDGTVHSIMVMTVDVTERSLARLREQQLLEEHSATNEELAAANEELAAINEELHEAQEEQQQLIVNLVMERKERHNAEAKLSMAVEAAKMGSWHINPKTKELHYNTTLAMLFGFEGAESMTYDQAMAQVTEDFRDKVSEEIEKAMNDGGVYDITYTQRRFNDGEVIWLRSLGKMTIDGQGKTTVFSGIVMDVTEQKQDEQRKNDFIGMVSHELKTPLTSLNGYTQLLQIRASKSGDAFASNALLKVADQIKRMTSLINGFLNISRLESGKIYLNKENFDLDELIREHIEESGILITTHRVLFKPCESVVVFADRDKVGSVISNMISNAVKYSPEGQEIEVRCDIVDSFVQVSVKDYGIGIRPKDTAKLFDRFYRVESDQTQLISGFGIGLYLSAEIVGRHQGKIWVESELSFGSTFYFTLPLTKPA